MATARAKTAPPPWSQIWQMPTLVAGFVLLGVGVYMAMPTKEKNDFGAQLTDVATLIDRYDFAGAKQKLDEVEAKLHLASVDDRPYYASLAKALRGDLIYIEQARDQSNIEANHRVIVDHYAKARELGLAFADDRLRRWADALLSLGREDEAVALFEKHAVDDEAKRSLLRTVIDRRLENLGGGDPSNVVPLLQRYEALVKSETNTTERRRGEIWLAATDARVRLAANDPLRAVKGLMVRYQRLAASGGDADLVPLMVQFGRAYLRTGDYEEAERYFLNATQQLKSTDPRNAEILIGLGQIAQIHHNDDSRALAYYQQVVREYPSTEANLRAMLGMADVEARIEAHGDALDHFADAIEVIKRRERQNGPSWQDPMRDEAVDMIRAHADLNYDRQSFSLAIDYLSLIGGLYKDPAEMPAGLNLRFAVCFEKYGEQRRGDAERMSGADAARRLANIESARNFESAAKQYLAHASKVQNIDDEYGHSMWRAAQAFDAAELWDQSIDVYLEFLERRGQSDPLYIKASYKLGLAYLADKRYEAAKMRFRELVNHHPRSPDAIASLVPLARCHDRLGETDAAIKVLDEVVTNHPTITPKSREYREALIELGRIHYKRQEYEPAIARLTEAVERYEDEKRGTELRFLLADCFRQSAEQINAEINESLTRSQQAAFRVEHAKRLESAMKLYNEVVDRFDQKLADHLTDIERLYQRNAYFFRADCAFDLGRYLESIKLYDKAARKWERDPASLIARIQMVNAYCELGDYRKARMENDKARALFANIPDSAFEDPNLPMNRTHWENWLRWSDELNLFDAQANVAGGRGE